METLYKRNLRLLFGIRVARSTTLAIPVIVPFYYENGLNQFQITLLQAAFAISMVMVELPSGYFADVMSRKTSIVLGGIFGLIGFTVYSLSYGFWPMLAAEVLLGVGMSCISGADSASAYDSMLAMDEQASYRSFESRSTAYASIAEALASVLGGVIALVSLRATLFAEIFVEVIVVGCALLLVEPERLTARRKPSVRDILSITKFAVHEHIELKWLMLYAAVIGTLTHTMVWLIQPYYAQVGVAIGLYGVLWAGQMGAMAIFSHFAHRYEQLLGRGKFMASLITLGVVAYALLGTFSSIVMLPFILAFYFIRGVQMPIMRDYVNACIDSDVRATVLSVMSLLQRLLYVVLGPVIGLVVDRSGLSAALLFSGVVYGVLGGAVVLRMRMLKVI